MSDLIDDPSPGQNAPEFTVSELSGAVKRTLEGAFDRIRVRGEVGRVFVARSGHLYYDLKDDNNVLACTTWKGQAARLSVRPEEGLEVVVSGRLTAFGAQSKYNLNVDEVTVAGEGALMALLEKRKKALQAEGLFAAERKKPLPYLPDVIGVITSPSGAVIRDILHRLRDRFPRKVLIWPVAVQGQNCAPEVARAISGFNALTPGGALPRPDLLIVARGGGSVEDLWGFNEEIVARAVAASDIPLISAVGHETDTTLIDFVSDQRAPTPTAAAELAVPVRLELLARVGEQDGRLSRSIAQNLTQRRQRLRDLARAMPRASALVENARQRLDRTTDRLPASLRAVAAKKRVRFSELSGSLRPAALRRLTGEARARYVERASRLNPDIMARDIARKQEQLAAAVARLRVAASSQNHLRRQRLTALDRMRQTLGYTETLARGYAVIRAEGHVVTTMNQAVEFAELNIEFADGQVPVHRSAQDKATVPHPDKNTKKARKNPAKSTKPSSQGSLF